MKTLEFIRENYVTLREYFDERIRSIEKAVDLARAAMEKRLEGMNEFRDSLKDQAARMPTREEMEAHISKLEGRIKILENSKAFLEGKASQFSFYIALTFSVIAVIMGAINLLK